LSDLAYDLLVCYHSSTLVGGAVVEWQGLHYCVSAEPAFLVQSRDGPKWLGKFEGCNHLVASSPII